MSQLALGVLYSSIGDRLMDLSRVDLAESDHSDAIIMDTLTFGRLNAALVRVGKCGVAAGAPAVADTCILH